MKRTITVMGQGKASATPDYLILSLFLEVLHKEYDVAMEMAGRQLSLLRDSLTTGGFGKDDMKTSSFRVNTEYESIQDSDGNYQNVFKGYLISHDLRLSFDFDAGRLAETLAAIAESPAEPRLSIAFTVKYQTELKDNILRQASTAARRKALILCESSAVTLGKLQSINYTWSEANMYSKTDFNLGERVMLMKSGIPEFVPDDIEVEDTVTFIWEIE